MMSGGGGGYIEPPGEYVSNVSAMSERNERVISTVRFAQWCTTRGEIGEHFHSRMVHQ
jgi:hypothetical protein